MVWYTGCFMRFYSFFQFTHCTLVSTWNGSLSPWILCSFHIWVGQKAKMHETLCKIENEIWMKSSWFILTIIHHTQAMPSPRRRAQCCVEAFEWFNSDIYQLRFGRLMVFQIILSMFLGNIFLLLSWCKK